MPWESDFRVSTITYDINNGAVTPVRGIVSASAPANVEVEHEQSAGSIYADTITVRRARPVVSFTTVDIPSAITAFGLVGKCIDGDADDEGIAFYGQKQSCIGVASGSVHDKYLIKSAIVVPTTLSVDHLGNAQLSYDVYTRSTDGTTAPIVRSASNALPAVSAGPIGRWTMRSMTVGGVTVTGKRNITINFGATVTQEGADSEIYDSVTSLASVFPVINVRGVDPAWFNTVTTLLGGLATHANTSIQLKRRDKAINLTEHIVLTGNGTVTLDTLFNAQLQSPTECAFNVHLNHDGTNAPILALTGQTLS